MRRFNRKPRNYNKVNTQRNNTETRRSRRLDMRKTEEFNYMLNKIVEELPDSVRGAIKGGLYSIASKQGTKEAREYISKIFDEGIIDDSTQKKLYNLIGDYSKVR
ncbi:MAG: hypothetical protein M1129_02025 [Candidatus Thermoplasmatota archaeon]|jgi:hypothetical protein|nr:hypothetical protein [Candidatus Thermoplasmatota archaeon]MCL5955611.1 hypothetical protein [Candidatus Thermoplasmatota archaeon]